MISNHSSLALLMAFIVKSNCSNHTLFSAHNEVLQTLGVSIGEGVYQTIRTFRHRESAVRMIFHTL